MKHSIIIKLINFQTQTDSDFLQKIIAVVVDSYYTGGF